MRLFLIFFLSSLLAVQGLHAETVKLKITYKGSGISDHKVSVMIGGAVLGSGTTNSNGEVDISVSSLPTKHIDLKGEKICDGGRKNWEVKGYVTLDGSNYAHLKMEDPMSEMVEASGGFMSEGMLASSYGLVCAGSSGSGSSGSSGGSSNDSGDGDDSGNSSSSTNVELMSREERLELQKVNLESKISGLERKIAKNERKMEDEGLAQSKKNEALLDNNVYKAEKNLAEHRLDKVEKTIANGSLSKSERKAHKSKEDELKADLDDAKSDRKKGKVANKDTVEAEKTDSYKYTEADMASLSTIKLKQAKVRLKNALNSKNLSLKTKRKLMSPEKIEKMESDVSIIESSLEIIQTEIDNRKGKDEETEEAVEEKSEDAEE